MALILFVAELGSGFGHVRRLLPLARAAVEAGFNARFLVSNPKEVGTFVTGPGLELGPAPALGRPSHGLPPPSAIATSFADILGAVGFADADFLKNASVTWQAALARLRPHAIVSELSPFLHLACFGSSVPHLSVGHGFGLPPPELPHFPALTPGKPLYSEEQLFDNALRACRVTGRLSPDHLPALLAGSTHAVVGLDELDPYRKLRREGALGPPSLDVDLGSVILPTEDVFVYLLGEAPTTIAVLRALVESCARGCAFIRRGTAEQRAVLAGSAVRWLDRPEAVREAIPRARIVVHHGSMLLSEEALAAGRSQLLVPLYLEHAVTARSLLALGVARVLRPSEGVDGVAQALASTRETQAAGAFAARFREGGGVPSTLAAELVDRVTGRKRQARKAAVDDPQAPWLSIVVPSYQMAPYLELSLQSFAELRKHSAKAFEVVVVDDGSSDATADLLAAARDRDVGFELRSVRRERDARSCRSLARNLGAAESRGDYLLFLDAGVLPHPELANLLHRRWHDEVTAGGHVFLLGTLGLFAAQLAKDGLGAIDRFRALSSTALVAAFDALANDPAWRDPRQPWFDSTRGDLALLPAPWALAWSCALGVPRRAFAAVGGFDERMTTWGAEDCDLGLRLQGSGAHFGAFAAPVALHVPHPTEAALERKTQHGENARRMHARHFSRDGELFVTFEDPFATNSWALRLDRAPIERLLPTWDEEILSAFRDLLGDRESSLVFGAPSPLVAAHLSGVTWGVPSRPSFENLAHSSGPRAVQLTIGCHTNEPSGSRSTVVLTDFLRLLPVPLQAAQLREALRVGRRALLACVAEARDWDAQDCVRAGFCWTPIARLAAAAESAGIQLDLVRTSSPRLVVHGLRTKD